MLRRGLPRVPHRHELERPTPRFSIMRQIIVLLLLMAASLVSHAGEPARFNAFSTSARISGGMSRFFSAASTALRCSDEKRVGAT